MNVRKYSGLLIPFIAAIFFAVTGFAGFYRTVDSFFYDILLHLSPSPQESEQIVLIDVDDATVDPNTGVSTWPIPREYYGNALITLKEFGAHSAVFDVEFVGRSQLEFAPADLTDNLVTPIAQRLDAIQSNVNEYLAEVFALFAAGRINRDQLQEELATVIEVNDQHFDFVLELLSDFSFDRDLQLSRGAALFGNSYFASNLREVEGEGSTGEQAEKRREFYLSAAEQIEILIEAAPELLTDEVLKLLSREDIHHLLSLIEDQLATADADTDFLQLAQTAAAASGREIDEKWVNLLGSPAVLDLFLQTRSRIERISLTSVKAEENAVANYPYIELATDVVVDGATGIGFSNVEIDPDGTRRRISLLARTGPFFYPQLSFSALLSYLGNPEIEAESRLVRLKGAQFPDRNEPVDIEIPLDPDGFMLINWPHKRYMGLRDEEGNRLPGRKGEDSFQHLSFLILNNTVALEPALARHLSQYTDHPDYWWFPHWDRLTALFAEIAEARRYLIQVEADEEVMNHYRGLKLELDSLLDQLVTPEILANLEREILSGENSPEDVAEMESISTAVSASSDEIAPWLASYRFARQETARLVKGNICILGFTATSTTDFGVNPFQEDYANVGTHASAMNTILQQDFLKELPLWLSVLLAITLSFAIYFILKPINPAAQVAWGLSSLLGLVVVVWAIFLLSGSYLPLFVPLAAMAVTFVGSTAGRFVSTSKEKVFIRKAFSHYLSTDVINEIMKDPDKLKLGGDSRYMTAIFTDVKGFSTISEKLSPVDLVHLLNDYLSDMSDIILDLRGLIDKYEGDAIIAFFGAPHDVPEHAYLTCLAAVRMKRVEMKLNERFLASEMTPAPLLTRIGINTGEMVVGNMGTATKMNYTMMGSAVNLAARLEGVNKQYGTWILISDETYRAGGDRFFCRKIDRVRVVGINQPVQLYEVIEEESHVTQEVRRGVDFFHKGLEHYAAHRWTPAVRCFRQTLELIPGDPPALKYIERCEAFHKKAPPANWDGVTNLTSK